MFATTQRGYTAGNLTVLLLMMVIKYAPEAQAAQGQGSWAELQRSSRPFKSTAHYYTTVMLDKPTPQSTYYLDNCYNQCGNTYTLSPSDRAYVKGFLSDYVTPLDTHCTITFVVDHSGYNLAFSFSSRSDLKDSGVTLRLYDNYGTSSLLADYNRIFRLPTQEKDAGSNVITVELMNRRRSNGFRINMTIKPAIRNSIGGLIGCSIFFAMCAALIIFCCCRQRHERCQQCQRRQSDHTSMTSLSGNLDTMPHSNTNPSMPPPQYESVASISGGGMPSPPPPSYDSLKVSDHTRY